MTKTSIWAGLLIACASPAAPQPPAPVAVPPPETRPAADASVDAAGDAAVASVGPDAAVVAPEIPPDLASVTPWVYRELRTGAINMRHRLSIMQLYRQGDRAALLVEERETTGSEMFAERVDGFVTKSFKLYVGTATARGRRVTLSLRAGAEALDLPCKLSRLAVARANAVRVKSSNDRECGDRGTWRPGTSKQVEVLSCLPFEQDSPDPDRQEQIAFAVAPGIEFLYVNDDCDMQGGDYRAIPSDGSIANVRARR